MSIPKNISNAVGKKLNYNQDKMDIWYSKFYKARRIMIEKMYEENKSCRYCGQEVNLHDNKSYSFATCDHIIPVAKGGKNNRSNLTLSCQRCNIIKGNMTGDEFKELIKDKKYWLNKKNAELVELLNDYSKNIIDPNSTQRQKNFKISFVFSIMMFDKDIKNKIEKLILDLENNISHRLDQYYLEIDKINSKYKGLC